ncbi:major facilitator superfamily domain-containing protein [Vararia minispora EC-137]|uniref:Major facilitator superfamily domain-containing protein n=1 Tax=Vararia minispora EC-137 TaxID=1314806 RepID=A0ACB8QTW5_9AGAM|nr:major facilitator superfamily domain-containing protein [Vararia minispora EC-137]
MSSPSVLSTVAGSKKSTWGKLHSLVSRTHPPATHPIERHDPSSAGGSEVSTIAQDTYVDDPDYKLPKLRYLIILNLQTVMSEVTFYIIISSGNQYSESLGGTNTFSGLVIGIPTVFSGLALAPMVRYDGGAYKWPLLFSACASVLGNVLYGLAYKAQFLYLILISRIVLGVSFLSYLYVKRYCSDSRIVGARRRTTLASWLVVMQSLGFAVGPFVGGLLYKIGLRNEVFNGYTSPGWVMAALWVVFGTAIALFFDDVPRTTRPADVESIPPKPTSVMPTKEQITEIHRVFEEKSGQPDSVTPTASSPSLSSDDRGLTWRQWVVVGTMCWFAIVCFFILGAWEANIPIYTLQTFGSSPFAAGNLIALGGICTLPFMLANVRLVRRVQDRWILVVGSLLGLVGLLLAVGLLATGKMTYWTLFACWLFIALGFNLASTVTVSLISKQVPYRWNVRTALFIQYSNYIGRVAGAVWGGAGVGMGMLNNIGLEIALLGIGLVMCVAFWKQMKAKTG